MELTSPLTTLGSISTPESFYTAHDSAADDTTLSSPVEDVLFWEEPTYRPAVQLPRELRQHCQIHLEEELYAAAIHILSGLIADGSTTSSHQRSRFPPPKQKPRPVLVAPPSQLALLATLIIHPSFTSRPPELTHLHAASQAFYYLRGLLATVGPINANLSAAFSFSNSNFGRSTTTTTTTRSHSNRRPTLYPPPAPRKSTGNADGGNDSDDSLSSDTTAPGRKNGPLAPAHLLFRRAPDFWAVLGWTFRCAAEAGQHPRWRYWSVWLDMMVEALEADWDGRVTLQNEGGGKMQEESSSSKSVLRQALIVQYVEDLQRERRNCLREVLKAVFAFSDPENGVSDRALFREVFERETVVRKEGAQSKRKREQEAVVDLENDQFGDYLDGDDFEFDDEDDEAGTAPAAPRRERRPGRKPKAASAASSAAFTLTDELAETVPFRLRIFRLLSAVSDAFPDTLASVGELYEGFTDQVRSLPLPMFRLFVDRIARGVGGSGAADNLLMAECVQVSFLRMLIEDLLPATPPPPAAPAASAKQTRRSTSARRQSARNQNQNQTQAQTQTQKPPNETPENDPAPTSNEETETGITLPLLQTRFLPFAASKVTAQDNAKLSLALEAMMTFVFAHIDVAYSAGLRRAVEMGIQAREERVNGGGLGGGGRRGRWVGTGAGGTAGGGSAMEREAREVLARSGRNLRSLVDVIAVMSGR
ncbi:uncharacterized protein C8A04DRAFT_28656 [Dichotomopilus funicola]|uniref:Uncharacterized protein n=1 Tax=Dichotomopilus funicola TaxID=1934379 RepID=A0AAN6ZN03_9PEZI|nr:hypothetical protein C8A04DRAFT_28656 [Dichotomopilus funicola]